ncbi:MAG TPA: di-heme oxidoredictase family protein [Candidatus Kapabacteria bacterium]
MNKLRLAPFLIVALMVGSCSEEPTVESLDAEIAKSGGETTVFLATSTSYATPAPNLGQVNLDLHTEGDAAFEEAFVSAPAEVSGGLGPVFNSFSCVNCHPRDGRGRPPLPGEFLNSMLLRVSVPGMNPHGGPNPVPGFGGQYQQRSNFGVKPEGSVAISYSEINGSYADGEAYSLRVPAFTLTNTYVPLPPGVMTSARVAPPVFGLGLLEAITPSTIEALADESDVNGDGISGKVNRVYDVEDGTTKVGRFGWKANTPTLYQQVATAYSEDMGITNPLLKVEACHGQEQYYEYTDKTEIGQGVLDATTLYVRTLAVPARRNLNDPTNRRGEKLFVEANCGKCHIQEVVTGTLANVPEVSNQKIRPYTDLLLHDMGEGLSDGRPDYLASPTEWRTPPLWGIGLAQLVNGYIFFLHDGRARTYEEAILWHGGEAEASKEFFRKLPKSDRDAMVSFLKSL